MNFLFHSKIRKNQVDNYNGIVIEKAIKIKNKNYNSDM